MVRRKQKTKRWLSQHSRDPYVRRAGSEGYRSRAAYKLQQIDEKERLIRPGQTIVELGAAPGGWTQYIARRQQGKGTLVAVDLLDMAPVSGTAYIQGDFTDAAVRERIAEAVAGSPVDLVISDLAPNLTGVAVRDQAQAGALWIAVLEFATQVLAPGGNLLLKLFTGEEAEAIVRQCRSQFSSSVVRKPDASRSRSREFYLLNRGFRAG